MARSNKTWGLQALVIAVACIGVAIFCWTQTSSPMPGCSGSFSSKTDAGEWVALACAIVAGALGLFFLVQGIRVMFMRPPEE